MGLSVLDLHLSVMQVEWSGSHHTVSDATLDSVDKWYELGRYELLRFTL